MTHDVDWLGAVWDFTAPRLPEAPATVVEIGCGRVGGLVPRLTEAGYAAVGVDPNAPDEAGYLLEEFERYEPAEPADAAVASASLHHVADIDVALDHLKTIVKPGGTVVVLEWAWERFDERTARWCFERLPEPADDEHRSWLHFHRDEWPASGKPWADYVTAWASEDGMHPAEQVIAGLDARLDRVYYAEAPFLFAQLDGITAADEQAAIDAGRITAVGRRYVGRAN